ncbi:MAG: hypothetical protein Q4A67_00780 [Aerococcus sp.]|nr:hypothetical protein [Aerococcus sp.]
MPLIPLPFQPQQHTHLATWAIKADLTVRELPIAYHNLLNLSANGGYTTASYLKIKHATLDGENILYVPYIAGLSAAAVDQRYFVPNLLEQNKFRFHEAVRSYEIIFYEDHDRVLTFGYQNAMQPNQPQIIYHEYSTDTHFVVAETFQQFLDNLRFHPDPLPHVSLDSYHRANAAFLHAKSPRELAHCFRHYADPHLNADTQWYQAWLDYYATHENAAYQLISKEAAENFDASR